MNPFSFENDGLHTYLVYKATAEETIDESCLGMLTYNHINGISPVIFTQMNDERIFRFDISSAVSLQQYCENVISRKRFLDILSQIVQTLIALDEYMIDVSSVLLDFSYIYVSLTTHKPILICLPVIREHQVVHIEDFFRKLLFSVQIDPHENLDFIAFLMNFLHRTENFTLFDFLNTIENLKASDHTSPAKEQEPSPAKEEKSRFAQEIVYVPSGQQVQMQPIETYGQTSKEVEYEQRNLLEAPVVIDTNKAKVSKKADTRLHTPPVQSSTTTNGGKPMSLFYLLSHYSKENLQIYQQQKQQAVSGAVQAVPQAETKKSKKATKEQQSIPAGVAIPGSNASIQITGGAAAQIDNNNYDVVIPGNNTPPPVSEEKQGIKIESVKSVKTADFGTTVYYKDVENIDDTVFYRQEQQQKAEPVLYNRRLNQKFTINKPIFRIGRDANTNDCVVEDNKFIGHAHCHIQKRDTAYYVVDDHSKNHTYINDVVIPAGGEMKISNGQTLRLANEEFIFQES